MQIELLSKIPAALTRYGFMYVLLWRAHEPLATFCCTRRNERARTLLEQFRQSQMYEVFIQERLAVAAEDREFESIGASKGVGKLKSPLH